MSKKMLQAAAGNAGESLYVEEVFSTYLYGGTQALQTIDNGIDLASEGGLVWIKNRNNAGATSSHVLLDTERGATSQLSSDTTSAAATGYLDSYNSDGFTLKSTGGAKYNYIGADYASWTFRKAEKFFDVVTYTGTGSNQAISHNLGSVPGCIIVRALSGDNWYVWHNSLSTSGAGSSTGHKRLILNSTAAEEGRNGINTVTSTSFTVLGSDGETGGNGTSYVAYVFAHTPTSNFVEESFSASYFADGTSPVSVNGPDGSGEYNMYTNTSIGNTYAKIAGVNYQVSGTNNWDGISDVIFAATGSRYKQGAYEYTNGGVAPHYQVDYYSQYGGPVYEDEESFIVCGSWDATGNNEVDLGFEPQWILIKNANGTNNWGIFDTMRGWTADGGIKNLKPDLSGTETSENTVIKVTSTGFTWVPAVSGNTYIYMAIRRPMKTPESGTEVFAPFIYTGNNVGGRELGSLSGADSILASSRNTSDSIYPNWQSKLQGNSTRLVTSDNGSEYTSPSFCYSFGNIQDGVTVSGSDMNGSGKTYVAYEFKRATGFMDVVAYTGNGTAGTTETHNLNAIPELMIVKRRSASYDWVVYHKDVGATKALFLNKTDSAETQVQWWNNTAPTSSVFTKGNVLTFSGQTYIAYLFATVAGVSKVGSYTGNGTSQTIDCGFSNGARFVLFKNASISDNWYVFDTVRGIVSGADPYLRLNLNLTEQSEDFIDPDSSGFAVSGNDPANNRNGSTYIFLAIA